MDARRGAAVLAEIIGWDWSGRMTHDGYACYDRFENAVHQQCVDHALRRARALVDKQTDAAKYFPQQVIELLTGAWQVRNAFLAGTIDHAALVQAHDDYVAALLEMTEPLRLNELNERLAAHLYHHGEQWLQFLEDPDIPATNHRAEQALKTPIVNRKVWGGNRTDTESAWQVGRRRCWRRARRRRSMLSDSSATPSAACSATYSLPPSLPRPLNKHHLVIGA